MSFVERVVGHVRRVQQIAEGAARDKRVVIDYGRHQASLVAATDRAVREGARVSPQANYIWTTDARRRFIQELHWELLGGLGADLSLEERTRLVDFGLAFTAGVGTWSEHAIGPIWQDVIARLVLELGSLDRSTFAWTTLSERPQWTDVVDYCRELGLVVELQGCWSASAAGHVLLRLRGLGCVRWLLALEVTEAVGRFDPWRVDSESLVRVLEAGSVSHRYEIEEEYEIIEFSSVERLAVMGVVEVANSAQGYSWDLTAAGREILSEVLDPSRPMTLMARAMRGDDVDRVVAMLEPAGVAAGGRVDATLRHARMVAHEVRNALGPVQHASRALRAALGPAASDTRVQDHLSAIDQGITRLHRFVTESVRLVPPEPQRLAPFSILEAIAEARKELTPDGVGSLTIETLPVSADPRCHGNRGQFVMAMLNVLRNAQQAAGQQVQIAIRVDARNPQQLLLSIEDDGPGVPDAVREHIFENGVSYREDGTGHGLASLRAVVDDMGGKVRCTTSELGGAKFEIVLPMVEASP